MRALMFSDWCVIKKYLAHYLFTSLVIGGFTAMGNAGDPSAMTIAMTCCVCYTSSLFIMFALFGADDRGEWARGRLELLPIGRTDVVKTRYGIMALAITATMAAGFVASLGLALAVSLVNGFETGQLGYLFAPEPLLALLATVASLFAILAIQMPLVFPLGSNAGKSPRARHSCSSSFLGSSRSEGQSSLSRETSPLLPPRCRRLWSPSASSAPPPPPTSSRCSSRRASTPTASCRPKSLGRATRPPKSTSDTRCPFAGGGQSVRRLPSFLPLLRLLFSFKVMLGRGA